MHFCPYFGHTYCLELWSCTWANKFCQYQSLKLIAVILPPEKWVAKREVFLFFLGKAIFSGGELLVSGRGISKNFGVGRGFVSGWHFGHFNFGGLKFSCIKSMLIFCERKFGGWISSNGRKWISPNGWGLRLGFPFQDRPPGFTNGEGRLEGDSCECTYCFHVYKKSV